MSQIYNKYGAMHNERVEEVSSVMRDQAHMLFQELTDGGMSLADVRLAAAYLISTIEVALSEHVLREAIKMRKREKSL